MYFSSRWRRLCPCTKLYNQTVLENPKFSIFIWVLWIVFCGSGYSGTIAFRGSGVGGNAVCTAETAHCLVIGFLRSYGLDLGIGETIMGVLFEVDGFGSGMSGRILFYVGRGSPRQSQGGHLERGSG